MKVLGFCPFPSRMRDADYFFVRSPADTKKSLMVQLTQVGWRTQKNYERKTYARRHECMHE